MTRQKDGIYFSFEGNIADEHELSFYESARFQYSAARIIYITEHFRQTGNALEKMSKKVDADIRVSTAKKGSWELAISLAAIPSLAGCTISVPLKTLFLYLLNYVKKPAKPEELALKLAELEVEKEKERTKQTSEETKRLEIVRDIVSTQSATTNQALELLATYHTDNSDDKGLDNRPMLVKELDAQINYEAEVAPYIDELQSIPAEKMERMALLVRKNGSELAYPLRSSANTLSIGVGSNNSKAKTVIFDRDSLENLSEEKEDDTPTYLVGSIKAYDKETGWGKFRNNGDFYKPLPFHVPANIRKKNLKKITKSMGSNLIGASFYIVRNHAKTPIRLIMNNIIDTDLKDE